MNFFERKIQVVLESTQKQTKIFSSEDGFTIEFEVEFGTRATSKIKIYNVLPSTVEMCKSANGKFATVELSAGYGEDMYLLTSAKILSVEYKVSELERILEILTGAKVDVLQNFISKTYQNFSASMILKDIFSTVGILSYSIDIEDFIISSICFNNSLQNVLTEICKITKSVWHVKNGKIFIESKEAKAKRDLEIIFISPSSGLINSPEVKGVNLKVKTLLNPNLNYGTLFTLSYKDVFSNKFIEGNYKVLNGKHFGGNKIQSYYTEFECIKQ